MAFFNMTLLLGGALMAIPIVLHLVMRRQPKRLVFPALRFLKQRRESNRRELQIRHWLLLLLRCAVIGLLAAALARPHVDSAALAMWIVVALLAVLALLASLAASLAAVQRRGWGLVAALGTIVGLLLIAMVLTGSAALRRSASITHGNQRAPVAAVMVFDTSPRMEYRSENVTRLDLARETATWLIGQLPAQSDVAVMTARPDPAVFSVDLAAAGRAVERLQTTGAAQPLWPVLERALALAQTSTKQRKELYLFTDMAAAAWRGEPDPQLRSKLDAAKDVAVYVIDVGAAEPRNVSLGALELSMQSLTRNDQLRIETELSGLGEGGTYAVELYLEEPDPQRPVIVEGQWLLPDAQLRQRKEVVLEEDQSSRVELSIRGLPPGTHQGFVKVAGRDPLPIDDIRYFAVEVKDAWPVLVVAPEGALTSFLTEAIAPYEFRRTDQARFECTVIGQSDLPNRALENYSAVCLLDPQPLTPTAWEDLGRYVEIGGALAVFLGHNALPTTSFNDPAAQKVLGGELKRQWRAADRDIFLAPQRYQHPILAEFRQQATSVPWDRTPVLRHWVLENLGPQTSVVARFSNNKPALLDTGLGAGRVVTMSAPVSDPNRAAGRTSWLELNTSDWPYFVLLNEILLYLVDSGETRLNYLAGEAAVLANDADRDPPRYQLFAPSQQLQDVVARDGQLAVRFTENPGAYRLKGYRGGPAVRGFAVNLAPHHSDLERLPREQLDQLFGEDRYRYARDRDEIEMEVGQGRVGREFYPYLIALLGLVLGLEQLLANRFYPKPPSAESPDSDDTGTAEVTDSSTSRPAASAGLAATTGSGEPARLSTLDSGLPTPR